MPRIESRQCELVARLLRKSENCQHISSSALPPEPRPGSALEARCDSSYVQTLPAIMLARPFLTKAIVHWVIEHKPCRMVMKVKASRLAIEESH